MAGTLISASGGIDYLRVIPAIDRHTGNIRETIPKPLFNDHETHKTRMAHILMNVAMGRQRSFGSNLHLHGTFSPQPATRVAGRNEGDE